MPLEAFEKISVAASRGYLGLQERLCPKAMQQPPEEELERSPVQHSLYEFP